MLNKIFVFCLRFGFEVMFLSWYNVIEDGKDKKLSLDC